MRDIYIYIYFTIITNIVGYTLLGQLKWCFVMVKENKQKGMWGCTKRNP